MSKNEIHARLPPEMFEQLKHFTKLHNFPTISHTVRWLLDIGIKTTKTNSAVELIANTECPNCGFIHGALGNTLCAYRNSKLEVDSQKLEKEVIETSLNNSIELEPEDFIEW